MGINSKSVHKNNYALSIGVDIFFIQQEDISMIYVGNAFTELIARCATKN